MTQIRQLLDLAMDVLSYIEVPLSCIETDQLEPHAEELVVCFTRQVVESEFESKMQEVVEQKEKREKREDEIESKMQEVVEQEEKREDEIESKMQEVVEQEEKQEEEKQEDEKQKGSKPTMPVAAIMLARKPLAEKVKKKAKISMMPTMPPRMHAINANANCLRCGWAKSKHPKKQFGLPKCRFQHCAMCKLRQSFHYGGYMGAFCAVTAALQFSNN